MSNLLIVNAFVCVVGFLMGVYTFIKHLKAFSTAKTPVVDAWLMSIGMLAWSIMLYASFDDPIITRLEVFSRFLFLVYWVGDILKVQKHYIKIRRRFRRKI
ncbi:hypothetical protein [Moraxella lacunata]|uniref:Uncharacterized protein n=1 Tax=Moraxella lacunata TaxID=477 RepID=A0A1V4GV19_MORLA|nr:hypothetical protein [Moraxella lacunata]OPH36519.1 hypothetical protein B5J94_07245 [Moraxella lacunata]